MKKHFLTGIIIILPIVLTIIVIMFIVNLLTRPFLGFVKSTLPQTKLFSEYLTFLSNEQAIVFISKFLILIVLSICILIIGIIGRNFLLKSVFRIGDQVINKIPVISPVHKAFKEVVNTLIKPESTSFTQVVLVPFPHEDTLCIGMLISDHLPEGSDSDKANLLSVFIPATPNPTIGFMILVERKNAIYMDMPVDEGLKFVVSCGIMYEEFKRKG